MWCSYRGRSDVPRAKPFTQSDVDLRGTKLCTAPIKRLVDRIKEKKPQGFDTEKLSAQISASLAAYDAYLVVTDQERPANIIAALSGGEKLAIELRNWLRSLPQSVRFQLKMPNAESVLLELWGYIDVQKDYWRRHVIARRPNENERRLALRQNLLAIVAEHLPNAPELEQRHLVADLLTERGIPFPAEKKNRRRFTGRSRQKRTKQRTV
jgi:hypothetical protein